MKLIVLGTHNLKKRRELETLLTPHGIRVATLKDFDDVLEVEETGDTFAANAALKAEQQAVHLDQWVLGEDSGLEVDLLDGAPGVYSARYSGPEATDASNNAKLLAELGDAPLSKRGARYVCHIALSDPQGQIRLNVQACCRGRIQSREAGAAGFGYDPLFEVPEYHRTFGQLGDTVKSVLSHRSRAIRRLLPKLLKLLG